MDINKSDSQKKLQKMSYIYKALGDVTRLKIILLLLQTKKLCVNAIANRVGLTQPAISQQLKILKHAGIIEAQKVGLYVHYSLSKETIDENIKDFTHLFKGGDQNECVKCPE